MDKGRSILLLNGPSSAGKTTLAHEIQAHTPSDWYWLPLDAFFDAVPSRLWDRDESAGFRMAYNLHHDCVKLANDRGLNVIVDTVICGRDTFAALGRCLAGYDVTMVKVTCPVEELNRRELAWGDRDIGLAAGQVDNLVPQTCTTSSSTPPCCRPRNAPAVSSRCWTARRRPQRFAR